MHLLTNKSLLVDEAEAAGVAGQAHGLGRGLLVLDQVGVASLVPHHAGFHGQFLPFQHAVLALGTQKGLPARDDLLALLHFACFEGQALLAHP